MTEAIDFESTVEEIDRTPVKVIIRNKNDLNNQAVIEVDFRTAVIWSVMLTDGPHYRLWAADTRGFHCVFIGDQVATIQFKPKSELATAFKKQVKDKVLDSPIERQT